jgi:hypothetical protein
MKYLVLLVHNGTGEPMPMTKYPLDELDQDRIALFDSFTEADEAGAHHPMGIAAGYEVVPWLHCGEGVNS